MSASGCPLRKAQRIRWPFQIQNGRAAEAAALFCRRVSAAASPCRALLRASRALRVSTDDASASSSRRSRAHPRPSVRATRRAPAPRRFFCILRNTPPSSATAICADRAGLYERFRSLPRRSRQHRFGNAVLDVPHIRDDELAPQLEACWALVGEQAADVAELALAPRDFFFDVLDDIFAAVLYRAVLHRRERDERAGRAVGQFLGLRQKLRQRVMYLPILCAAIGALESS